jgi:hypothetical protein
MIEVNIGRKSDFRSAVKDGVLYLEVCIPERIHIFSPLDIGMRIIVRASLYDADIIDKIPCEVVKYFFRNGRQYAVVREISKNSLQQFEECCAP